MDLRGSRIYGSPNENPKCASVSRQGLPGKEPQNPSGDVNLQARPVLGNITNNPEISERCLWPASRSKATTKPADTLTATALSPPRGFTKCLNGVQAPVPSREQSGCDVTIESGYGGSDTSFSSVSSYSCGILSRPCDFPDHALPNGPNCKRPRGEAQELTTYTTSTVKRPKASPLSPMREHHSPAQAKTKMSQKMTANLTGAPSNPSSHVILFGRLLLTGYNWRNFWPNADDRILPFPFWIDPR
ncbi:hypothetical protein D915_009235 [Fasciola hepatica]|uniref:Uncharacterized protein n=1 Tax=Fasciola hepatica TaxID=6192 RepID=A0A2H1BWJ7_FASHE|nr:hypothetical protein D915_009235 [Fasciola hepatica]